MANQVKKEVAALRAKIQKLEESIAIPPSPITEEWIRRRNMVNTDIHIAERKIEHLRQNKSPLGEDLGEISLPNPAMRKIIRVQT